MHRKIKIALDIAMLLLFIIELAGMFVPSRVHMVLGALLLVAVIAHNIVNSKFYQTLLQGPYTPRRIGNGLTIFLLLFCFMVLAVSGMALGFPALSGPWRDVNWRSVHLVAAIAALVLLLFHILFQGRRYFRPRKLIAVILPVFIIAAAGIFGLPYLDRWFRTVEVDREAIVHGEKVALPGKTLTLYFSRVGNTDFPKDTDAVSGASVMKDGETLIGNAQMLAYMAQDITGSDLAEIRTVTSYPVSYTETAKVGRQELQAEEPPPIQKNLPNLEQYDTIILIYPLWWGTVPRVVESALQPYDLTGKRLIPIVTHGSSGAGDSLAALGRMTTAKVGPDCLTVYSSDVPRARKKLVEFLRKEMGKGLLVFSLVPRSQSHASPQNLPSIRW